MKYSYLQGSSDRFWPGDLVDFDRNQGQSTTCWEFAANDARDLDVALALNGQARFPIVSVTFRTFDHTRGIR
jgi:hypothetical protein